MLEYAVLCKGTIKYSTKPCLSVAKRGFTSKFDLVEVVNIILYKLKTGCQWHLLSVSHLFSGGCPTWNTVFHHYRKWCKADDWQHTFTELVCSSKDKVDLLLAYIDGSHTPAYRGGEHIAEQGWKMCKTTNALYLVDRNGIPLAMSEPQGGNHNDLYEIENHVDELAKQMRRAALTYWFATV